MTLTYLRVSALALIFATFFGANSWAEDYSLNPDMAVGDIIRAAESGTHFLFEPGEYTDPIFIKGRELILEGAPGAMLRVSGDAPAIFLVEGANVVVKGLEISGAVTGRPMVWVQQSTLELIDTSVGQTSGDALFAAGSTVRLRDSVISTQSGIAVLLSEGSRATIVATEIRSATDPALAINMSGDIIVEGAKIFGAPAVRVVDVSAPVSFTDSWMWGEAADRSAFYFSNDSDLSIARSFISGGAATFLGDMSGADALSIDESIVISTGYGAVDILGDGESVLDITDSVFIVSDLQAENPPIGVYFEGPDFAPTIQNSAILAQNGIALAVHKGAGVFVQGSTLFGRRTPLWLNENESEITFFEDSFLLPSDENLDRDVLDLDTSKRLASNQESALARVSALTASITDLANSGEAGAAEIISDLSPTLVQLADISRQQLSGAASFASLSVTGTDIAGVERPVKFSVMDENVANIASFEAGEVADNIPPGAYSVIVPAADSVEDITVGSESLSFNFDLVDTLFFTLAEADKAAEQHVVLKLLPKEQRIAAMRQLITTDSRAGIAFPRLDLDPQILQSALGAARKWLAKIDAPEARVPEDSDARVVHWATTAFAERIIALYGEGREDAVRLSKFKQYDGTLPQSFSQRFVQTAFMEARTGTLANGVLRQRFEQPLVGDVFIPALLLHTYGVGAGTEKILSILSRPLYYGELDDVEATSGLTPHQAGYAIAQMLGTDVRELIVASKAVIAHYKHADSPPAFGISAPLAYLLAYGDARDIAETMRDMPPLTFHDAYYLIPLLSDLAPLIAAARRLETNAGVIALRVLQRHLPLAEREARIAEIDAAAHYVFSRWDGGDTPSISEKQKVDSNYASYQTFYAAEKPSASAAKFGYSPRLHQWGAAPPMFMAQLYRMNEAVAGLEAGTREGLLMAQLLNYLTSAQVTEMLASADLSKWPEPELVRLGMQTVSRAFTDKMFTQRRPITHQADGTIRMPFVLVDRPADGEGKVGSISGILYLTPEVRRGKLVLSVHQDQQSYYHGRCPGLIEIGDSCNEKIWRNYPYTARNAAKLIAGARLVRFTSGQEPQTIPLERREEDDQLVLSGQIGEDGLDGLSLVLNLEYGPEIAIETALPLWHHPFAAVQIHHRELAVAAKALIDDPSVGADRLLALAQEHAGLGILASAEALYVAWGERAEQRAEGVLRAAELYLAKSEAGLAQLVLQNGVERNPSSGALLFELGNVAMRAGDYQTAYGSFKPLADAFPDDGEVMAKQGVSAFYLADFDEALRSFELMDAVAKTAPIRLLEILAKRQNSAEAQGSLEAFLSDLGGVAAQRADAAVLPDDELDTLLAGNSATMPTHCDSAAFGGWWLLTSNVPSGVEQGARYLDFARQACPADGSIADHLSRLQR